MRTGRDVQRFNIDGPNNNTAMAAHAFYTRAGSPSEHKRDQFPYRDKAMPTPNFYSREGKASPFGNQSDIFSRSEKIISTTNFRQVSPCQVPPSAIANFECPCLEEPSPKCKFVPDPEIEELRIRLEAITPRMNGICGILDRVGEDMVQLKDMIFARRKTIVDLDSLIKQGPPKWVPEPMPPFVPRDCSVEAVPPIKCPCGPSAALPSTPVKIGFNYPSTGKIASKTFAPIEKTPSANYPSTSKIASKTFVPIKKPSSTNQAPAEAISFIPSSEPKANSEPSSRNSTVSGDTQIIAEAIVEEIIVPRAVSQAFEIEPEVNREPDEPVSIVRRNSSISSSTSNSTPTRKQIVHEERPPQQHPEQKVHQQAQGQRQQQVQQQQEQRPPQRVATRLKRNTRTSETDRTPRYTEVFADAEAVLNQLRRDSSSR